MGKLLIKRDNLRLPPLDYTKIVVGQHEIIVDPEDFGRLIKFRWSIKMSNVCWYACRKVRRHGRTITVKMHRELMNAPPGMDVHHRNHNTLDNRKANLIICTPEQHKVIQRDLF